MNHNNQRDLYILFERKKTTKLVAERIITLCDVGELQFGGLYGEARRSRWAIITTAVCRRSIARSLSCGKIK